MGVKRRTKMAGVMCSVTLTFAALASTAGVASASPTRSVSTAEASTVTGTARPYLYDWWIYYYYPNTVLGLGRCLAVGAALKLAGVVQNYYCGDPEDGTGADRIALWVYSQIT